MKHIKSNRILLGIGVGLTSVWLGLPGLTDARGAEGQANAAGRPPTIAEPKPDEVLRLWPGDAPNPGLLLENRSLCLTAAPGRPGVAICLKSAERTECANITIQSAGGAPGAPISKAEVGEDEAGERSLRIVAGTVQAEISLGPGVFVKVNPGKNAASIEVKAGARYAALPDFFADDVIFDPVKFQRPSLGVPAENFLLQFVEGGDTIVMCIWPGNLKLPPGGGTAAPHGRIAKEGAEPRVDLVFSGEGKARRISAVRIEFKNTSTARLDKWWERGDENAPQIWQESLASYFIYPAVLKDDEVRLCLYADKATRRKKQRAKQADGPPAASAPQPGPPNVYERVIIYPLGRVRSTPLDVYTPVDLMRETLGTGPCEYVLDLAGVKPQPAGGDRPILSYATCGLWDDHILPITRQFKFQPGGAYEPLDEKTKTHLIQALEDMWYFVHAVHDRLREYRQWGAEMAAFCARESDRSPTVRPLVEKAMLYIQRLNADIGRHRFDGPGSEAYWKDRIPELIAMVKQDRYGEVATIGKIRDLGNEQDERVSRCRQYVKALRQEVLLADADDADTRALAAEIRDRCHQMLRNMHPKEGF